MTGGEELVERDVEEQADRFVELENDIRDAYLDAKTEDTEPDGSLDLTLSNIRSMIHSPAATTAQVIAAERNGGHVAITISDGSGGTVTRTIPYPDDPTDRTEPLVRLCNWDDTPVDRIADLDTVPAVGTGDSRRIFAPPGRRIRATEVTLPGGLTTTVHREPLHSRLRRARNRWYRYLTASAVIDGDLRSQSADPDNVFPAAFAVPALPGFAIMFAGLAAGSAVIGLSGLLVYMVGLVMILFGGFHIDTSSNVFDTY